MPVDKEMIRLIAATIRGLTVDAVQAANSGHPGLPMGMADAAAVLWAHVLKHDPACPEWVDRDRFVLSAGHGSMLLYSLLHLCGYDLPLDQLRAFRQLGSKTPGHPEVGHTVGVETTTGPLGQGFANGVGMAVAERFLGGTFNRSPHDVVDHCIYAIVSDGDLMEGVAAEAASLAGHLKLGKLVYLYDDNAITIDGGTDLTFSEDVGARFRAYGWHVLAIDGHDIDAIEQALLAGKQERERPTLICARTVIGKGSPSFAGTSDIHSDPVGEEEIARIKEELGLPPEPFHVPEAVQAFFAERRRDWISKRLAWEADFGDWRACHPDLAQRFDDAVSARLPSDLSAQIAEFSGRGPMATRACGGEILQSLAAACPTLVGGSADLACSNKTTLKGAGFQSAAEPGGRNIHFGVREHAMGAILNGMALHGGVHPFGATFLVFSDYMRPAIRLAALSNLSVAFVFTHDSVFVGEDGPTHQPVEQLASLRAMPNVEVWRPADGCETAAAWLETLGRTSGPSVLALSRQKLPQLDGSSREGAARGGYVVRACEGVPEVVVVCTGSEVHVAVEAAEKVTASGGGAVRVVSVPCLERFLAQGRDYVGEVLALGSAVQVVVEAGVRFGWADVVGRDAVFVCQEGFGASAPSADLARHLGFDVGGILQAVEKALSRV